MIHSLKGAAHTERSVDDNNLNDDNLFAKSYKLEVLSLNFHC